MEKTVPATPIVEERRHSARLRRVATLVFFVNHMSGRINVDTVIEFVSRDVSAAPARLGSDQADPAPDMWRGAAPVVDARRGYLQQLDHKGLATWAAEHETSIRLLARPGDNLFPGAPIALVSPRVEGIGEAIHDATALGPSGSVPPTSNA
ncbi:DUF2254 domain-containing protein [Lichenihabitans sp. PAMC28606]|uniref:DUF2254 family protein n=1 Tax=Lichenihabitans sp. PAMC28606 TaxID=2880932 RepID=UPI001D09D46A|nr:DUF2254 family protein [Lichenihabitans sp. PAMC28606]UDL96227.1 DUF2254 domain-containing protein [Lichenihabitans sp. PAMC28606]